MANDSETTEPSAGDEAPGRTWRPSRRPDYQLGQATRGFEHRVFERTRPRGFLRTLIDLIRRPAVKLVIGISLFIVGAIVFDATINDGSWTQRATKKQVQQKGR